jgi:hypothetical protein
MFIFGIADVLITSSREVVFIAMLPVPPKAPDIFIVY